VALECVDEKGSGVVFGLGFGTSSDSDSPDSSFFDDVRLYRYHLLLIFARPLCPFQLFALLPRFHVVHEQRIRWYGPFCYHRDFEQPSLLL
jgi:hypothetical protein